MSATSLHPHLKAIFFDLDDTLVFSEQTHTKAWQLSLPQFGINPHEIDFQSMTGMSDMEQAILFKTRFNIKEDAQSLFELKRETFLELSTAGFECAAGRNELLEQLSQIYRLGIVSSSPHKIIHQVLHSEKINSFFNFVIGYEDCEHHKPHPLPYLNALKKAGVAPHEALVIEDSVTGITSALKASIPVVGLLKNQRPEQMIDTISYFKNFSEMHAHFFSK